jgi:DNA-directed RNA polymerase specialized sigma24 family protein
MTSFIQVIAPLLPRLRRYARAVTGDRRTGERYVDIVLEILAEEPWHVWPGEDVKFRLYKLFDQVLSIFEPARSDASSDQADPYDGLRHGVMDLPLSSRKLLLLVTVERFPLSRAAEMLEMPAREAELHLAGARAQLCGVEVRDLPAERILQEQAA